MSSQIFTFSNIASFLGIAGVSFTTLVSDALTAHVALAAFITLWVIFCGYGMYRIHCWLSKTYPKGYLPISAYSRYTTFDGVNVVHETYRQVQIKHAFLKKIPHRYFWTGTKDPSLASNLQKIGAVTTDPITKFRCVDLEFQQARFYNEIEIIHTKSMVDDSDERSEPYLSINAEMPIRLLLFRVELLHLSNQKYSTLVANVERRTLGATQGSAYLPVTNVNFDLNSRSFEHVITDPEPGYVYRIRWSRPEKRQRGRSKRAP